MNTRSEKPQRNAKYAHPLYADARILFSLKVPSGGRVWSARCKKRTVSER